MLHKNISTLIENFQNKEEEATQEIIDTISLLSTLIQQEPDFLQNYSAPLNALKEFLENITTPSPKTPLSPPTLPPEAPLPKNEGNKEEGHSLQEQNATKEKRYEPLKVLGKGGMGIVQLVRDSLLNREVAQKTIKNFHLGGSLPSRHQEMSLWRFRREAELTGQLEHPHIVPLYDLEEKQGELRFTLLDFSTL